MNAKKIYYGMTVNNLIVPGAKSFDEVSAAVFRAQDETGFNAAELWMDRVCREPGVYYPEEYTPALIRQMKGFLSRFEWRGVHLPFAHSDYTSINPVVAKAAKDQLLLGLQISAELGAHYCVGHARFQNCNIVPLDENFRRYGDVLREFSTLARKSGIRYCVETCEFLDTIEKMDRLVREVNHPSFGLTLDAGKVVTYAGNEGLFKLMDMSAGHIGSTHLWDFETPVARGGRRILPGSGACDLKGVVKKLVKQGYSGSYNLETGGSYDEQKLAVITLKGFIDEALAAG